MLIIGKLSLPVDKLTFLKTNARLKFVYSHGFLSITGNVFIGIEGVWAMPLRSLCE